MKVSREQCPICAAKEVDPVAGIQFDAPVVECGACGFRWIGAPLTAELADKIYNGKDYHSAWGITEGAAEPNFVIETKRAIAKKLVQSVGGVKGLDVLEVGCATGIMLEYFKEAGARESYGVELSAKAAARAKQRLGAEHIWAGDLVSWPLEKRFDLIFAIDLLEHVADPEATLALFQARLKPQGRIVLVLPNLESQSARLLGRFWPEYKQEHRFYFSRDTLRELLGRKNLKLSHWSRFAKSMSFAYFFAVLQHTSGSALVRGISGFLRKLFLPLGSVAVPLPSGNALAVVEKSA